MSKNRVEIRQDVLLVNGVDISDKAVRFRVEPEHGVDTLVIIDCGGHEPRGEGISDRVNVSITRSYSPVTGPNYVLNVRDADVIMEFTRIPEADHLCRGSGQPVTDLRRD